jgi:maltose alpha-D-glucosyltransferase / alpha-amylase
MRSVVSDSSTVLDPTFIQALASVPATAWSAWLRDLPLSNVTSPAARRTLVATFGLPPSKGHAALCVFETDAGNGASTLHQAALRRWPGAAPAGAALLHHELASDGSILWSLASAWADQELRTWLLEALSAGASLRADEWEWQATPERSSVGRMADHISRELPDRRHDVVLFEPGAVATVYRRVTRGAQPELDLLRHLERVPGVRVAPALLGSAILRGPNGQRSASAALEALVPHAATLRSVIVHRLRRALEGDPSLQASALDDARAAGAIANELHTALGRPFDHGVVIGASPASEVDVEAWVARAWSTLSAATDALRRQAPLDAPLLDAMALLPGKLQQFAAAAKLAPGLMHRVHGNLRLECVLVSPPRVLSLVEFDGDAVLSDAERIAPQSPWRDVAQALLSLAQAAAEAAQSVGGDAKAFEIAWLWEREARKAFLEGYGTGAGALHALVALFELEFAARDVLDAVSRPAGATIVGAHTLLRLTRTIV